MLGLEVGTDTEAGSPDPGGAASWVCPHAGGDSPSHQGLPSPTYGASLPGFRVPLSVGAPGTSRSSSIRGRCVPLPLLLLLLPHVLNFYGLNEPCVYRQCLEWGTEVSAAVAGILGDSGTRGASGLPFPWFVKDSPRFCGSGLSPSLPLSPCELTPCVSLLGLL